MHDLKRAFGSPNAQFKERVRQTLFRIEEKEVVIVKKKLTLSMALALTLCLTICLVSAFAASELLSTQSPDTTRLPLSQGTQTTPGPDVFYHSEDGSRFAGYYHIYSDCSGITGAVAVFENALFSLGKNACPQCMPDKLYTTEHDVFYHLSVNCPLCPDHPDDFAPAEMEALGMYPCPHCIRRQYIFQYADGGDPCCHTDSKCPVISEYGADSYAPGTLLQADTLGRTPCLLCAVRTASPTSMPTALLPAAIVTPMPTSEAVSAYPTPMPASEPPAASSSTTPPPEYAAQTDAIVYIGADGSRYHHIRDCSSASGEMMKTYESVAIASGQTACPECLPEVTGSAPETLRTLPAVFAAEDDPYYHRHSQCISLNGKRLLSEEQTWVRCSSGDLTACPFCIQPLTSNAAERNVVVSEDDCFYHTLTQCSALSGHSHVISEALAVASGRSACTVCLYCYVSVSDQNMFHMDRACIASADAECMSAMDAISAGAQPCPDCVYWTAASGALYHNSLDCLNAAVPCFDPSDCLNGDTESCVPCTLEYTLLFGKTLCADQRKMQTAQDDLLTGNRTVYITDPENSLYHLYADCPGTENALQLLLSDAQKEGRAACESCLTIYTHSHPGQSSGLLVDLLTAPQETPSGQTHTLTVEASGFRDNLLTTVPIEQDKWVSGSLTVHSLITLSTRAGIYLEAEFSLTDPEIDPESIRMTYYCEGYGSFGWNGASVTPINYEDGSAGWILQTVLPKLTLPETADRSENGIMSLRVYGTTSDGQSEVMFSFK